MMIGVQGLPCDVAIPDNVAGTVIFAHGSGSSRMSPRNRQVARALNQARLATLLFDLLTPDEAEDRRNVFNIALLSQRVEEAINAARENKHLQGLRIGLFGASTGAAAALCAAAVEGDRVSAVVSRGGRPDLAFEKLGRVVSPTLLIVGGLDHQVISLNEQAYSALHCEKRMEVVPGATHLFEEPGTMEQVIGLASRWFAHFLRGQPS
jgi:pimeloyl-ACP methyl ester carboxylesterase